MKTTRTHGLLIEWTLEEETDLSPYGPGPSRAVTIDEITIEDPDMASACFDPDEYDFSTCAQGDVINETDPNLGGLYDDEQITEQLT